MVASSFMHKTGALLSGFFPAPQFMNPLAAALDISESSVKYLTLSRKGNLFVPEEFIQVQLAPGIVKAGDILKPDELTKILKGIAVKHGAGEVYVSLPEEFAYIYPITVASSQTADQVKAAVEFSMSEHVPLPQQQIVYDYVTIPHVQGKARYISVTGYDSKKSETYLEVVSRAGFTVRALETEVHAAVRSCVPENTEGTVLLFDVGRTRTGITAVLNGIPISTSTIEEGGRCTTEALLAIAENDIAKAEALKLQHGLRVTEVYPEVKQLVNTCLSDWSSKIRAYVEFLSEAHPTSEVPTPPVSKIYLCGGEAGTPGFADWVASELHIPVEVGDVWNKLFKYDDFIPTISRPDSLRLATAAGLVLRNLNE